MAAPEFQTYEVDGLGGWEGMVIIGLVQDRNSIALLVWPVSRQQVVMEGVREQIQCGRLGSLPVFPLSCLVSAAFFS